jgi:ribosomal-protein-serine acetyltransferase
MQSEEDMRKYLKNCELLFEQGQEISFIIIANESIIGRIGLNHIDRVNKNASIGYWIIKNAEGKGITSKSCEMLIRYGFQKLGLQRIEIRAATTNLKSQAIPKRFCFSQEGILRQAELVNHQFLDLVVFSVLKEEWEKRKAF